MKILVIGGSGQVGSKLREITNSSEFSFYYPDSCDLDLSCEKKITTFYESIRPDLVVNLGAYTKVDLAEDRKETTYNINYLGVKFLCEITNKNKIGLIHFSTDYVFGNEGAPFSPQDKKSPLNHYGATKSLGEDVIIRNHNNYLIIRLASVFGELGNNFIKTMFSLINDKKDVKIVGDQNISLTYAGDVANLILFICKYYNQYKNLNIFNDNVMHFTNKGFTNWYEVSKLIHNEISLRKANATLAKMISISYKDWPSKALRSKDSRLNVNFDLLEKIGIQIPSWDNRVKKVVDFLLIERRNKDHE